jgi:hypothetical protein
MLYWEILLPGLVSMVLAILPKEDTVKSSSRFDDCPHSSHRILRCCCRNLITFRGEQFWLPEISPPPLIRGNGCRLVYLLCTENINISSLLSAQTVLVGELERGPTVNTSSLFWSVVVDHLPEEGIDKHEHQVQSPAHGSLDS